MTTPKLVIFDFDGTLADTYGWFLSILDDAIAKFRLYKPHPEEVEAMRGLSARQVMTRMKVRPWKLPAIVRHTRREKLKAAATTQLFDGITELMRDLRAAGIKVAIVSSDTTESVRRVLDREGIEVDLLNCGASLHGKTNKFKKVLKQMGVDAKDAVSVGDEIRDIEAAKPINMRCGAVSWGYTLPEALESHHPTYLFRDVAHMRQILLGQAEA
ncbi:HAD-IA family hydrolase [uncultured Brevundimonas sp.]|uniref:HAD-IA family hydrolase n=1 Tax=uncultured Brevundimonas sp. TaxID=213418 RepID=UPI00262419C1|nr:HAD-IA family hydrolase [uncultured Brevundimonas sp.]